MFLICIVPKSCYDSIVFVDQIYGEMVLMLCSECGHEQSEGMFCGLCGNKLVPKKSATAGIEDDRIDTYDELAHKDSDQSEGSSSGHFGSSDEDVAAGQQVGQDQQASNESLDRVVETSREFGSFFQQFMKVPSRVFDEGSKQLTHALITLVILSVLFSITFYQIMKFDFMGIRPPFMSLAGNAFLFIVISIVTIIAIIFLINKLFGNERLSFTDVVSIYGVFMIPTVIILAASFLLALIKSYTFSMVLLAISMGFVTAIIPLYMVSYFVINYRKKLDPLYAYLIYVFLSSIGLLIVYGIILDSILGEFIYYLNRGFDFY